MDKKEKINVMIMLGIMFILIVLGGLLGFQIGYSDSSGKACAAKQEYIDRYCYCPEIEETDSFYVPQTILE